MDRQPTTPSENQPRTKAPRTPLLVHVLFLRHLALPAAFCLLPAAYCLLSPAFCPAQTGISPGPMRAAEAYPLPPVTPADAAPFAQSGRASQPLLSPRRDVALAPYGYPSGYPDSISESADAARNLGPQPSIVPGVPMIVDPYATGAPMLAPGQPPAIAPPIIVGPGVAEPIVEGNQVIIPGELPLELSDQPPPVVVAPAVPRGQKNGVLQRVSFLTSYLPKFDDDGLGMVDFENSVMLGFPFPTREMPLVLTPGFDFHLLDGPDSVAAGGADLPPQLYDIYLQIRWMAKVSDRWSLTLATTPGYYTDFEGDNSNALRVTAQALAIWEWRPQSQLIFGVVYLDREDIGFLPAGGLIWTPNEANRLELIFPRPRFLHCFHQTAIYEDWWSIGAEFGGGEWAIQRASGADDVVDIKDYRITAGVERKSIDYLVGMRLEVGYVFGRSIEYQSGAASFDPSDTILVRGGFFY
jgi:hypothetical protein